MNLSFRFALDEVVPSGRYQPYTAWVPMWCNELQSAMSGPVPSETIFVSGEHASRTSDAIQRIIRDWNR